MRLHLFVSLLLLACVPTELVPGRCDKQSDCKAGLRCVESYCLAPDGAVDGDSPPATKIDGRPPLLDALSIDAPSGSDAPRSPDGATTPADAPQPADRTLPEVAECTTATTCPAARPLCVVGACVECGADGDCRTPERPLCIAGACRPCGSGGASACADKAGAKPVCAPSGACVECLEAASCKDPAKSFCVGNACTGCAAAGSAACTGRTPVCAPSGLCVECTTNAQCPDRASAFCVNNACVGCARAPSNACGVKDPATPGCGPSGSCVECTEAAHCKDPTKAFCVANACTGCATAGAGACRGVTPVCGPTGACVECTSDAQCADPSRPFCVGNSCVGCGRAAPGACAAKSGATPACGSTGACVECTTSADCSQDVGRPICAGTTCRRCTGDNECATKLGPNPGVCMAHQDGRCATEAETIFVSASGCGSSGTSSTPLCSPQDAASLFTPTRRLVVIRGTVPGLAWSPGPGQVTLVGQSSATLAGGAASSMRITGGDVYVRGIAATLSAMAAVVADSGATLRLDGVSVTGNPGGGILLDGARFELRNVSVTGNGPGKLGLASWGGIAVNNPLAGGPSRLDRVTVKDNKQVGLLCSAAITGSAVSATGNLAQDIDPTCAITSCGTPSASCGAP